MLSELTTRLGEALRIRVRSLSEHAEDYPICLSVDTAEELIRTLYEVAGHMGDDVGSAGYEFNLLTRVRELARELQIDILAAVAIVGPRLVERLPDDAEARS